MSDVKTLLTALLNGDSVDEFVPRSRIEAYLKNCCLACGCDGLPEPVSEIDALLFLLSEKLAGGGGTPVNNQDKTITQNGTYTADEGYTGLGTVNVNVASSGGDDGSFKAVIERTATEVTLPSDLTKIGRYVFYECRNLALTSLPSGITSIDPYAFYNCQVLALTSLPSGITSIGGNAFYYCFGLKEITFNGKPNDISTSAFRGCENLHTINVPWAEGEVANAPWGATNATINYNYTGG